MNDSIKTYTLKNVVVQQNGIIRNEKGRLIARLVDDVDFEGEHIAPLNTIPTQERTVEEIFEGYNYASFTWNSDNATGVKSAKKSFRVLKQRVAKALTAERQKREEVVEAERERIISILSNLIPREDDVTDVINDWIIPELKRYITQPNNSS